MTRLLLVRHGQSTWNAEGRWQGHSDPPLSQSVNARRAGGDHGAELGSPRCSARSSGRRPPSLWRLRADASWSCHRCANATWEWEGLTRGDRHTDSRDARGPREPTRVRERRVALGLGAARARGDPRRAWRRRDRPDRHARRRHPDRRAPPDTPSAPIPNLGGRWLVADGDTPSSATVRRLSTPTTPPSPMPGRMKATARAPLEWRTSWRAVRVPRIRASATGSRMVGPPEAGRRRCPTLSWRRSSATSTPPMPVSTPCATPPVASLRALPAWARAVPTRPGLERDAAYDVTRRRLAALDIGQTRCASGVRTCGPMPPRNPGRPRERDQRRKRARHVDATGRRSTTSAASRSPTTSKYRSSSTGERRWPSRSTGPRPSSRWAWPPAPLLTKAGHGAAAQGSTTRCSTATSWRRRGMTLSARVRSWPRSSGAPAAWPTSSPPSRPSRTKPSAPTLPGALVVAGRPG